MDQDYIEELLKLKQLFEKGIITKEELESAKTKLLRGDVSHSEKAENIASKQRDRKDPKWFYLAGIALVVIVAAILLLPKVFEKQPTVFYSAPTGTENGYGYVDMGLSVMWAANDLGAETPLEDGLFFLWGHTSPERSYTPDYANIDLYKLYKEQKKLRKAAEENVAVVEEMEATEAVEEDIELNVAPSFSKYNNNDGKTVLERADDAAYAMWGGKWRVPTKEDFNELFENTEASLVNHKGDYYLVFTSKINGNSIAFPFWHTFMTANLLDWDVAVFYAFTAYFDEEEYNYKGIKGSEDGTIWNLISLREEEPYPIRPVCDK